MVYDQDTGILSWRNRKDTRVRNNTPKGYIKFKIRNVHYKAHRLIWFYHYGRWPQGDVIDHVDRDIHNNRISNLREATFRQNARNTSRSRWVSDDIVKIEDQFVVKIEKSFATLEEAKAWQEQIVKIG